MHNFIHNLFKVIKYKRVLQCIKKGEKISLVRFYNIYLFLVCRGNGYQTVTKIRIILRRLGNSNFVQTEFV